MDVQQQPISDDQELAKVLAGITADADQPVEPADGLADNLEQEASDNQASDNATQVADPSAAALPVDSDLESIKSSALNELRPLVDKLNLSPEEKFDTYLLILRSTDDSTLVGPAFEAARGIADESVKAQALLDIVKEIDYLSNPQQQAQ